MTDPVAPGPRRRTARRMVVGGALLLMLGSAQASARQVHLTLLNTTDLHGSIRRTPGVYVDHNDGALLQCATIIQKIRAENPHTLLVDCGDVFQGTADSFLTQGGIMVQAMNALNYDAWAIGNHEFDWGLDRLGHLLRQMQAVPLAANLVVGPRAPDGFERVQPYVMREVDGLKVAIVGLTTPNLPQWFRGLADADLQVLKSRRALEQILPQIRRERPHILVLLAHQGLMARDDDANQIKAICRRFSEFDVVLGGHLHWVLAGARIGRTDYAQAGSGGRGVMRVDMVYDTVKGAVIDKTFTYLPVAVDTPTDEDLAALVADDLAQADRWLATVLGHTPTALKYSLAGAGLSPVQQLLCAAIAESTGAEVVLHGVLSTKSISAGELRVADIWPVVPYENTIGCAWLTVAEIRAIMEEAADYLGTKRYFGTWGLQYEVHPDAPRGHRIRRVRAVDGSPIHPKTRLKVALNSYHVAGGGGRFPEMNRILNRPPARLQHGDVPMRQMVMDYIQAHPQLSMPAGTNAVVVRDGPGR
ncbi:MAG: bifunctional UDP-sugar hydrolase/5'-nucleotidase [Kiritimatiellae bacterium]|nr:bifunctional UDP-sugar hydrolase/5'-nucleotidase [Kiritimatiellia bacterium]